MDDSKKFIKMCDKAPKELWDLVKNRNGTFFVWRGFLGILKPSPDRKPMGDFVKIIPETLVIRTWLNDDEDLVVIDKTDYETDRGTPLYRQDQLQEMIECDGDIQDKLVLFYQFARGGISGEKLDELVKKRKYAFQFNTMEQLWMAFAMYEIHQKIWDDEKEEWIKKN